MHRIDRTCSYFTSRLLSNEYLSVELLSLNLIKPFHLSFVGFQRDFDNLNGLKFWSVDLVRSQHRLTQLSSRIQLYGTAPCWIIRPTIEVVPMNSLDKIESLRIWALLSSFSSLAPSLSMFWLHQYICLLLSRISAPNPHEFSIKLPSGQQFLPRDHLDAGLGLPYRST